MQTRVFQERRRFKESSILFKTEKREAIDTAISTIRDHRMELEEYITLHPKFRYSLHPVSIKSEAPRVVKLMGRSTNPFNVGPMAAVAGVLADLAVEAMLNSMARIAIVENGGEIAASSDETFTIGLHVGKNIMSNRIGFQVKPSECPLGIATSSATIGHAISLGKAEAVTIFADTAGLADGAATATCNAVQGRNIAVSIQGGLKFVKEIGKIIHGAIIVRGKYVGIVGKIPQLIRIKGGLDMNKALLIDLDN